MRAFDELKNWANGVVNSTAADQLPTDAIPRGWNTYLTKLGDGTAQVGKRRGALTLNTTPVTGTPRILTGFQFKKRNGNKYELLISDNGRLDLLNADNTLTNISATAFTAGTHYPNLAVANDLVFICNDVDQKKFDGTTLYNFGITRPAAPTATPAVGGAMTAGAWDVALTYYNTNTGHESSLSDFTTVTLGGANLQINVSWSAPTDAQVTHVRVYVRQQSVGGNTYRATAGATPAPDATTGGYAIATTSTVLNISTTQYSNFITSAPSTTENNPPASGLQYPCWHNSRLFLADAGNIYWSKIKGNTAFPEAFDPLNSEPINPNDGDMIVGMASAFGRLLIFKKFSVWQVVGSDPNSWDVSMVCADFGLSSMRSMVRVEGLLYWWSVQGPMVWDGSGLPIPFGRKLLGDTLTADTLNQIQFAEVHGGLDENNQTVMWSVPEFGQLRNTRIIPFNYRAKRFDAELWNPFDVSSIWIVEDQEKQRVVHMSNYGGQVFKWWAAGVDGVPSGTSSGPVSSATATTLTDSTAAFVTTGGALKQRYVYALSADRTSVQRRLITSNTGTVLTISPAWSTTPNNTYTYVVGGIQFELDTPWVPGASGFQKKRFAFLLAEAISLDVGGRLDVDIFTSLDTASPKKTRTMTLTASGGIYDTALFEGANYAGNAMTYGKVRCGVVGRLWRARFRNLQPNVDLTFYRIAMESLTLSTKR